MARSAGNCFTPRCNVAFRVAQTTVYEAMLFSAKLRLPASVSNAVVHDFVEEIMDVVELTSLRSSLVGLPGAPPTLARLLRDLCTGQTFTV